jgi:hypothetical protein
MSRQKLSRMVWLSAFYDTASPQYGFGKAERRWRERARRRPRDQCREAERCHRQPATRLLSRISSART